ncbi:sulfatase-like hydrolase/transferase [Frondihabitans sp. PAMC 28766]|uniref:sulfatase-like hydrolase/transferase n=1 Tax=Frondihabitans sp. PAMC 28766 TaxID=1795630 RepID=UPI0009EAF915|nr:sulfatase-like hydrolase/transferase [Frondihabitans sp. PAMC 28766]
MTGTTSPRPERTPVHADDRPDLVIVMTDQHRADVHARDGFPLDTMPFVDSLAAQGVWFDRAYTTSPLCSPARTSLLTGRWPSAHRVTQNPAADQAVFGTDLFQAARGAGYATALFGKNHTYLRAEDVDAYVDFMHDGAVEPPPDPVDASFDGWLAGLRHRTAEEPTPFPTETQNPSRIVAAALEWVRSMPSDVPLCVIVSFPEPHNPYQVPAPYFDMFPSESLPPLRSDTIPRDKADTWRYLHDLGDAAVDDYDGILPRARSNYFGMLRLIDDQIRRLYDGLDDRHANRQRVIALTADHGDYVGEYGLVRKGAEVPDVLARIPFVVVGDAIRASRPAEPSAPEPEHVSIADLMPTFCEAMGVPIPDGVQGRSLWSVITGLEASPAEFASAYVEQGMGGLPYEADDVLPDPMPGLFRDGPGGAPRFDELNAVTQGGRRRKIRAGRWTLQVDVLGVCHLYDLEADPAELVDRWDDGTDEAKGAARALLAALAVWQMRAEDPLPTTPGGYLLKRDPRNWVR